MRKLSPAVQEAVMKLACSAMNAKATGDGRPFIVGHLITNRCMAKCKSCLWIDNDSTDVPTEELKSFYRQAKDAGFVATAISGGEPLLRKDLGEIVRYVKQDLGMSILLFNTGWLLEKRIDELLPHLDMMIISLDSAKAERHDQIRGLKGLYDRIMRVTPLVQARYPDVSLQFNCCVQKGTPDEIDDLVELAERMSMRISFDIITEKRHGEGAAGRSTEAGLPFEELQRVCAKLLRLKKSGAPILNTERYFDYFAQGRRGYQCHLPKVVMFVDGRGNVENCLGLDRPLGNYRETPLEEIMRGPRFRQLRTDAEGCSSCNSPTMIDCSHFWENPSLMLESGGIEFG